MLRKSARLKAAEVRTIIKDGKNTRFGGVSAKILRTEGLSRAAVVVTKAFARSAVARNRLRRAAYRALRTSLPRQGTEAVFFVKEKDTTVLAADINTLCSKLI